MTTRDIPHYRLFSQHIVASRCRTPAEVVAALGAIQAQDYPGALWSIALRLPAATEADIEQAIADRKIIRTWPMRGTLHFVPGADVRWMLELLAPRIIARRASLFKQLGLDAALFKRARKLLAPALKGGRQLTRAALMEILKRDGINVSGINGYHILSGLGHEQFLCFGSHAGKQPTFALLDEWVPKARKLDRDAALAELTRRYFISHGPATVHDFAWWSGLPIADARNGINLAAAQLRRETMDDTDYWMSPDLPEAIEASPSVHLLPGFDEFLLGYTDRSAVLDPRHERRIVPGGNGVFQPTLVTDGQITGTWKRTLSKNHVEIAVRHFTPRKKSAKHPAAPAAERFGEFLGVRARIR